MLHNGHGAKMHHSRHQDEVAYKVVMVCGDCAGGLELGDSEESQTSNDLCVSETNKECIEQFAPSIYTTVDCQSSLSPAKRGRRSLRFAT